MANPYYNPEEMGLEIVAQIDYSDGSCQFDYRIVWRHKETGKLFTARDSGCSCPTPFEDFGTVENLEEYSYNAIRSEAMEEGRRAYGYDGDPVQPFLDKLPQ